MGFSPSLSPAVCQYLQFSNTTTHALIEAQKQIVEAGEQRELSAYCSGSCSLVINFFFPFGLSSPSPSPN